jgi:hypothetical protein
MKHWFLFAALLAGCTDGTTDDKGGTDTDGTEVTLDAEGAVYELDPSGLDIQGAPGVGALLGAFFSRTIWIEFYDWSDDGTSMRLAFSETEDAATQDDCLPTTELTGATRSGLDFAFGPATVELNTGAAFTLDNLEFSGTFGADGDDIDDIVMTGVADTRAMAGFGGLGDEDAICTTLGGLGITCGDCGNGDMYCITLTAEGFTAAATTATVEADPTPGDDCITE